MLFTRKVSYFYFLSNMMLKYVIWTGLLALASGDDPPDGAYIQKIKPLNPYDIRGDDIDKGGEVSKGTIR